MAKHSFFAFLILCATAMPGPAGAQQRNLAIGTAGTGGVYYPLGGAMANILSKHLPGVQVTAEVTGGSIDNLKLIGADPTYLGLTSADVAADALRGEGRFHGRAVPVRTLVVLYPNHMQIVTLEGNGIDAVTDLKGKRVSLGAAGGGIEVAALRLLEAAGLDPDKDIKRERLSNADSASALKDRRIDAFFFVGGAPAAAITELGATPRVQIKLIDHAQYVEALNAKYGGVYSAGTIAANTYPGQGKRSTVVDVSNLLVAHEKMSDGDAYGITKTILENRRDLALVVKDASNTKLENQRSEKTPLPFHPGALKYYAEQGIKPD